VTMIPGINIPVIHNVAFGFCDLIAQSIIIYRCWIVWGRNIRVVVVPSILVFAFLASWMVCTSGLALAHRHMYYVGFVAGLAISITVNAAMTALIVFKILKVFRQVRMTSDGQISGDTGGRTLRHIIFVLIESGIALLFIQVFRIVVTVLNTTTANNAYAVIVSTRDALNGIAPTIILVRVSMGLSFYDADSLVDRVGSLCFACIDSNPILEAGSVGDQERAGTNLEDIEIQLSADSASIPRDNNSHVSG